MHASIAIAELNQQQFSVFYDARSASTNQVGCRIYQINTKSSIASRFGKYSYISNFNMTFSISLVHNMQQNKLASAYQCHQREVSLSRGQNFCHLHHHQTHHLTTKKNSFLHTQ